MNQGGDSIRKHIDFSKIDIGNDYVLLAPLAFLVFLMFLTLSIGVSIDWYFMKYALSDLADPAGTLSAGLFDAACISSGIVLSIYASCRLTRKKSKLDHVRTFLRLFIDSLHRGRTFPRYREAHARSYGHHARILHGIRHRYKNSCRILQGEEGAALPSISIMIAAIVSWRVMYGSPLELAVIILAFVWSIFQMLSERS